MSKQYPTELLQQDVVPPQLTRPANFRRKSNVLSVAICALVLPGLLATVALPAYGAGISPSKTGALSESSGASGDRSQSVHIGDAATPVGQITRDAVSYIAPPPPPPPIVTHVIRAAHSFGAVNLSGIAGIAARYLGVPYIYGGATPAGFDCSGFTQYVYAQVGISLPHSAEAQGRLGARVPVSAAVPGDVVVMDGGAHVGIYVGGGRMIDAPEPGRVVSVDAIYDGNYYIVRF